MPVEIGKRRDLTGTAKVIYAYLADLQGAKVAAWPGLKTIAEACGIRPATAFEAVKCLERAGLIEVNRDAKFNRYIVTETVTMKTPGIVTETVTHRYGNRNRLRPIFRSNINPHGSRRASGRVELKNTLAETCYDSPPKSGAPEWGRIEKAAKQLTASDVSPQELRNLASAYSRGWPGVALTPTALSNNVEKLRGMVAEGMAEPTDMERALEMCRGGGA